MTIYGDDFQKQYQGQIDAGENPIYGRKYQLDRLPGEPWGNALNIRPMRYADVLLMDAETRNELQQRDPGVEGDVDGREYFPIPQDEIDTNPAINENNPGC